MVGIVLAAGQSSRMGQPKALLPCPPDGRTFIACIVDTFRAGGVPDVLVIGRPDDAALKAQTSTLDPAVRFVENPEPERGQLSSLLVGIDHAGTADAVIVMPVDIPGVRAETISTILEAFRETLALIVRPMYRGRHGHPVLFRQAIFPALRQADPERGAKAVIRAHASATVNVDVEDAGILHDVDLPEDYERLFGVRP